MSTKKKKKEERNLKKIEELKGYAEFSAYLGTTEDGQTIFKFDYEYTGNLEFYYETGFESVASILHDDRGIDEKGYKSLSWAVFFNPGDYLQVFKDDKENEDEVVWEGLLIRDFEKLKDHIELNPDKSVQNHCFFQDITEEQWVDWFSNNYRAKVFTTRPVLAQDDNYNTQT